MTLAEFPEDDGRPKTCPPGHAGLITGRKQLPAGSWRKHFLASFTTAPTPVVEHLNPVDTLANLQTPPRHQDLSEEEQHLREERHEFWTSLCKALRGRDIEAAKNALDSLGEGAEDWQLGWARRKVNGLEERHNQLRQVLARGLKERDTNILRESVEEWGNLSPEPPELAAARKILAVRSDIRASKAHGDLAELRESIEEWTASPPAGLGWKVGDDLLVQRASTAYHDALACHERCDAACKAMDLAQLHDALDFARSVRLRLGPAFAEAEWLHDALNANDGLEKVAACGSSAALFSELQRMRLNNSSAVTIEVMEVSLSGMELSEALTASVKEGLSPVDAWIQGHPGAPPNVEGAAQAAQQLHEAAERGDVSSMVVALETLDSFSVPCAAEGIRDLSEFSWRRVEEFTTALDTIEKVVCDAVRADIHQMSKRLSKLTSKLARTAGPGILAACEEVKTSLDTEQLMAALSDLDTAALPAMSLFEDKDIQTMKNAKQSLGDVKEAKNSRRVELLAVVAARAESLLRTSHLPRDQGLTDSLTRRLSTALEPPSAALKSSWLYQARRIAACDLKLSTAAGQAFAAEKPKEEKENAHLDSGAPEIAVALADAIISAAKHRCLPASLAWGVCGLREALTRSLSIAETGSLKEWPGVPPSNALESALRTLAWGSTNDNPEVTAIQVPGAARAALATWRVLDAVRYRNANQLAAILFEVGVRQEGNEWVVAREVSGRWQNTIGPQIHQLKESQSLQEIVQHATVLRESWSGALAMEAGDFLLVSARRLDAVLVLLGVQSIEATEGALKLLQCIKDGDLCAFWALLGKSSVATLHVEGLSLPSSSGARAQFLGDVSSAVAADTGIDSSRITGTMWSGPRGNADVSTIQLTVAGGTGSALPPVAVLARLRVALESPSSALRRCRALGGGLMKSKVSVPRLEGPFGHRFPSDGTTVLHMACAAGEAAAAEQVMGVSPDLIWALDDDGFTPMQIALRCFRPQVPGERVQFLRRLINTAARHGQVKSSQLLLSSDVEGFTPFLLSDPINTEEIELLSGGPEDDPLPRFSSTEMQSLMDLPDAKLILRRIQDLVGDIDDPWKAIRPLNWALVGARVLDRGEIIMRPSDTVGERLKQVGQIIIRLLKGCTSDDPELSQKAFVSVRQLLKCTQGPLTRLKEPGESELVQGGTKTRAMQKVLPILRLKSRFSQSNARQSQPSASTKPSPSASPSKSSTGLQKPPVGRGANAGSAPFDARWPYRDELYATAAEVEQLSHKRLNENYGQLQGADADWLTGRLGEGNSLPAVLNASRGSGSVARAARLRCDCNINGGPPHVPDWVATRDIEGALSDFYLRKVPEDKLRRALMGSRIGDDLLTPQEALFMRLHSLWLREYMCAVRGLVEKCLQDVAARTFRGSEKPPEVKVGEVPDLSTVLELVEAELQPFCSRPLPPASEDPELRAELRAAAGLVLSLLSCSVVLDSLAELCRLLRALVGLRGNLQFLRMENGLHESHSEIRGYRDIVVWLACKAGQGSVVIEVRLHHNMLYLQKQALEIAQEVAGNAYDWGISAWATTNERRLRLAMARHSDAAGLRMTITEAASAGARSELLADAERAHCILATVDAAVIWDVASLESAMRNVKNLGVQMSTAARAAIRALGGELGLCERLRAAIAQAALTPDERGPNSPAADLGRAMRIVEHLLGAERASQLAAQELVGLLVERGGTGERVLAPGFTLKDAMGPRTSKNIIVAATEGVRMRLESALINRDSRQLYKWMPLAEQLTILSPEAAKLGVLARWATNLGIPESISKEEVQDQAVLAIQETFIQIKKAERKKCSSAGSRPQSPAPSEPDDNFNQLQQDAKILEVNLDEIEIPPPTAEPSVELPPVEDVEVASPEASS